MQINNKLRTVALNLLSQREHSRFELQNKLLKKDFAPNEIESLLDTLITENLLSDERFCEVFIRSRIAKGQGPLRIKEELRLRGIKEDIAAQHLGFQSDNSLTQIETVRRKRFGNELPQDFKERAKQMRFLQYRGFTIEQIKQTFKE